MIANTNMLYLLRGNSVANTFCQNDQFRPGSNELNADYAIYAHYKNMDPNPGLLFTKR